jgi:hypothetical protein
MESRTKLTWPEREGMRVFLAEIDFHGLREDKVSRAGGVLMSYVDDRAATWSTKQAAKYTRPTKHR